MANVAIGLTAILLAPPLGAAHLFSASQLGAVPVPLAVRDYERPLRPRLGLLDLEWESLK